METFNVASKAPKRVKYKIKIYRDTFRYFGKERVYFAGAQPYRSFASCLDKGEFHRKAHEFE